MAHNPWDVDSIEAFTFLKCPQCIFDTKEEENFLEHAFETHPMSRVFFDKILRKNDETGEDDLDSDYCYEAKKVEILETIKNCDNFKSEHLELPRG